MTINKIATHNEKEIFVTFLLTANYICFKAVTNFFSWIRIQGGFFHPESLIDSYKDNFKELLT